MAYVNKNLTFESNKIYYTEGDVEFEVMMSWEDSLMSASSKINSHFIESPQKL